MEYEQGGRERAGYGQEILARLSSDLTTRHGRGFSERNLRQMRTFYLGWEIRQTPSAEFEARVECPALSGEASGQMIPAPPAQSRMLQRASANPNPRALPSAFPLSWSHYVCLMSVEKRHVRAFYENEAIRGGWSVRQLDRQIGTRFFERFAHSRHSERLLARGRRADPEDAATPEGEVRDPYLLEFLNLTDEYSESDLEDAIIRHLEWFLLELGAGFTFVARQKRIRVGDAWYRMDLLLYHRRLKCLVVIDLKIGKFTHADAGQMNLYLNYAREHLMEAGENEPVGMILCSARDDAVVRYAMGGIKATVFASRYLTVLPDQETLRMEILATQRALALRQKEKARG